MSVDGRMQFVVQFLLLAFPSVEDDACAFAVTKHFGRSNLLFGQYSFHALGSRRGGITWLFSCLSEYCLLIIVCFCLFIFGLWRRSLFCICTWHDQRADRFASFSAESVIFSVFGSRSVPAEVVPPFRHIQHVVPEVVASVSSKWTKRGITSFQRFWYT